MIYTVVIDTSNDAFHQYAPDSLTHTEAVTMELARVLRELADEVEQQVKMTDRKVIDSNGNSCGTVKVKC